MPTLRRGFLRGLTGRRGVVAIVMYHAISELADAYSVHPKVFRQQIKTLADDYSFMRLADLAGPWAESSEKLRVIITFDDAYTDLIDHVLPILEAFSVPATVFVPTGLIGKRNEWDLGDDAAVARTILTAEQIKALAATGLIEFGAHTIDHCSMSSLSRQRMREEALGSKLALESLLGTPVFSFAYPYGQLDDFGFETTDVLRESGYRLAVTTHWGTVGRAANLLTLPRVWFRNGDSASDVRAKVEGFDNWITTKERLGYLSREAGRGMGLLAPVGRVKNRGKN